MHSKLHGALILAGAILVLIGMHYFISGTQHGEPTTTSHEVDTRTGVALVATGLLLQVGPTIAMIGASWRQISDRRLGFLSVTAVALVVALGLVAAGAGYLADGTQEGAPGGHGRDPSGQPDPALGGGVGEAGSPVDVWLGSSLMLAGVLLQMGLALIGWRHLSNNPFQPTLRATRSDE